MHILRESTLRVFAAFLFVAALTSLAGAVAAQPPARGPQIQAPGDPFCAVSEPQAALFGEREVWAWRQGGQVEPPEIGGAVFPPGGAMPSLSSLVLGEGPTGEMRLDQAGDVAWAAWPTSSGLSLQQLSPEGDQVAGLMVSLGLDAPVEAVDLAVTPRGRVFVAWLETPDEPSGPWRIFGQLFRADGSEATERTQIATLQSEPFFGFRGLAAVATAEDRFVVAWRDFGAGDGPIPGGSQILALPVREIATPGGLNPIILMPEDLILVSDASANVPFGATVESAPAAVATPMGGFVIAWHGSIQVDPPFPQTFLRRFDAEARALGPEQPVSANDLLPVTVSRPGLAVDDLGQLALTWEAFTRDFSGPPGAILRPVAAVLLDAQGFRLHEAFQVNDRSDLVHRNPSPAFSPDGDLLITWDEGPEASPLSAAPPCTGVGNFVLGRRFDTGCSMNAVCLLDNRFEVTVEWSDPFNGGSGTGTGVRLTSDTGAFWFFEEDNLELMVKVLDGTPINGHYWVFFGSLTNVEFALTVRDRLTDQENVYVNAPFEFGSVGDTMAFRAGS